MGWSREEELGARSGSERGAVGVWWGEREKFRESEEWGERDVMKHSHYLHSVPRWSQCLNASLVWSIWGSGSVHEAASHHTHVALASDFGEPALLIQQWVDAHGTLNQVNGGLQVCPLNPLSLYSSCSDQGSQGTRMWASHDNRLKKQYSLLLRFLIVNVFTKIQQN